MIMTLQKLLNHKMSLRVCCHVLETNETDNLLCCVHRHRDARGSRYYSEDILGRALLMLLVIGFMIMPHTPAQGLKNKWSSDAWSVFMKSDHCLQLRPLTPCTSVFKEKGGPSYIEPTWGSSWPQQVLFGVLDYYMLVHTTFITIKLILQLGYTGVIYKTVG